MPLSELDRRTIAEFREWFEGQLAGDRRFVGVERFDRPDESTLATRFAASERVWFELALRPLIPQVRAGILTDDRWKSEELEEAIEESGDTMVEFIEQGFADADLDWPEPPVEHYRDQGKFFYFATPLEIRSLTDLSDPHTRDKAKRMLEGYCHAFGHRVFRRV